MSQKDELYRRHEAPESSEGMTDLEKLTALLTEFEIPYQLLSDPPTEQGPIMQLYGVLYQPWVKAVFIGDYDNPAGPSVPRRTLRITGYYDAYARWEFDADGKFLRTGAWE